MRPDPVDSELGGLLGEAVRASRRGRLSRFIVDETSPAIALFDAAHQQGNVEGDWYGEHAGKWLIAAAKAAARSLDEALVASVRRVAAHLVSRQQDDGYLGTYAPARRFMVPQPPKPGSAAGVDGLRTWDGAPSLRTWDIWTHSYLILGLLEAHHRLAVPGCLQAACRIGDLCWHTLTAGGIDITDLGNHHGMSATVLMDPAMELHFATGEQRYLDLALHVLAQADRNPDLALVRRGLAGADAAEVATGKAYQLAWNLVGLAKIHQATHDPAHALVLDRLWHSFREQHLTLGGGPWGGVGHRSREVLNAPGTFSPQAYVETCSTLAWMQLNRELLRISGQARYADEIERSAYNDLLGAMAPNGEDWCYYSFPNGRRVHTTAWRCCKSSGAMALEELPSLAVRITPDQALFVDLLGPSRSVAVLPGTGRVTLEIHTDYPFDGRVVLTVTPERNARFELGVRVPGWSAGASLHVNGAPVATAAQPGQHARIDREWQAGDRVQLDLPMPPRLQRHVLQNVQESRAPDGSLVRQEVLHHEFVAITRGPLVYATGLVDGYKTEETIRLPDGPPERCLDVLDDGQHGGPTIRLSPRGRPPLHFVPAYRADARLDGHWRLTWLSLAPAAAEPATHNIP